MRSGRTSSVLPPEFEPSARSQTPYNGGKPPKPTRPKPLGSKLGDRFAALPPELAPSAPSLNRLPRGYSFPSGLLCETILARQRGNVKLQRRFLPNAPPCAAHALIRHAAINSPRTIAPRIHKHRYPSAMPSAAAISSKRTGPNSSYTAPSRPMSNAPQSARMFTILASSRSSRFTGYPPVCTISENPAEYSRLLRHGAMEPRRAREPAKPV